MKVQEIVERTFQSSLTDLYSQLKFPENKAWTRFLELGLPLGDEEAYRYIKLRELYSENFSLSSLSASVDVSSFVYPECKGSCLVFINGRYHPEYSLLDNLPKELVVLPLLEASKVYGSFLQQRLAFLLKEEKDPFVVLNAAFSKEGVFCYLPPHCVCEVPLQILHWVDDSQMMLSPKIHFFAGKNSSLKVYATQQLQGDVAHWINECVDITVEENACIDWTQIMKEKESAWHTFALRASLKRNSQFKSIMVTNGARTFRSDYHLLLQGEGCSANLEGTWLTQQKRHAHFHLLVDHQEPNTYSLQRFKGILTDFSRSSFEGKILVRKKAQKTQAYQSNPNLLLSDRAQAYSKPNLEIFADDVKASHGATVGQLDQDHLFYLKTRGIDAEQALSLLTLGFSKEIIDKISLKSSREEALALLSHFQPEF